MGYLQVLVALASGREAAGGEPAPGIGAPLQLRPRSRFEPVEDTGAAAFEAIDSAIPAASAKPVDSVSMPPAPKTAVNREPGPPAKPAYNVASPVETRRGGAEAPRPTGEESGAAELVSDAIAEASARDSSAGDVANDVSRSTANPATDVPGEESALPAEATIPALVEAQDQPAEAVKPVPASLNAAAEPELPGEQSAPEVHLSIGRVEVIVTGPEPPAPDDGAPPAPPPQPFTPPPAPPSPVPRALEGTSGFEGYTLRRRGWLR